jgi:uncharacterized protein
MLLIGGCGKPGPAPTAPVSSGGLPQRAQPPLPTLKLWLGAQEMTAELARTEAQIMTGMMFRTNLAESEGMLFVFSHPHRTSFWMRNVPIPLSCAYVDPAGTILEIHDMTPQEVTPIVADSDRIQFVLETAQGWFQRNRVSTGALVRTERGSLQETFFGRPPAPR